MSDNCYASIVVPTYNHMDSLPKLIQSLLKQTYPKEKYEIIICDDGSVDGTRQFIKAYQRIAHPLIRYFSQGHRGPAAARNLGLKYSRGMTVAFIDADCVASNIWLEELIKCLDINFDNHTAAVGGHMQVMQNGRLLSKYCNYINNSETSSQIDRNGNPAYLITANVSFSKYALDSVGGFDERFTFPGGEDQDICYRLKESGYHLRFNPKAIVYHYPRESIFKLLEAQFNYGKGEAFIQTHKGTTAMSLYPGFRAFFSVIKISRYIFNFHKKGFSLKTSIIFAILDYFRKLSFSIGIFTGYFTIRNKLSQKWI